MACGGHVVRALRLGRRPGYPGLGPALASTSNRSVASGFDVMSLPEERRSRKRRLNPHLWTDSPLRLPFAKCHAKTGQLPILEILCTLLKRMGIMNIDNQEQEVRGSEALQDTEGGGSPVSEALEEHRLTAEEIEDLKDQAAKANEHWEQMLRVAADFENFKKRAARERQETSRYANETLLQKLIPVLDNFEMALAAAGGAQNNSLQQLQTGIHMIYQQLRTALTE